MDNNANETVKKRIVPPGAVPLWAKKKLAASKSSLIDEQLANGNYNDNDDKSTELSAEAKKRMALWRAFERDILEKHDETLAIESFKEYLSWCPSDNNNLQRLCYEFFLDFSRGRPNKHTKNIIKNNRLAEFTIVYLDDLRDVDKLIAVTDFLSKQGKDDRAEDFFHTLYESFLNGDNVNRDLNRAAFYLKKLIDISNNAQGRYELCQKLCDELREIYKEQISASTEEERTRKAYEKSIAENIPFADRAYALYLKSHDNRMEAMQHFVAAGDLADAYSMANLRIKDELETTAETFRKGAADSIFAKSLNAMLENFETLQYILDFKAAPLPYYRMTILYSIFGPIYAMYHTAKLKIPAFLVGLVLTIVLAVTSGIMAETFEITLITACLLLYIWAIVSLIADIIRRRRYLSACNLWIKIQPHPQLEDKKIFFADSQSALQSTSSWTLVISFILLLITPLIIIGAIVQNSQMNEPDSTETVSEPQIESSEPTFDYSRDEPQIVTPDTAVKPRKESADQEPPNTMSAEDQAIGALVYYHQNITQKNYRRAYDFMAESLRSQINYDKWADGFRTTVKSEVYNVRIVQNRGNAITLTYVLEAVDNPGGTQYFDGTATIVDTAEGWRIADMRHKPGN